MTRKTLDLKYSTRSHTSLGEAIDALEELYGHEQVIKHEIGNLVIDVMAPYIAAFDNAPPEEVEQMIARSELRLRSRLNGALQFVSTRQQSTGIESQQKPDMNAETPVPVNVPSSVEEISGFTDITAETEY